VSKLPGVVARVALALEALRDPTAELITGETMRAACEWSPFLLAHFRTVLGEASDPEEVRHARRLLAAIKQDKLAELSARDAQRQADGLSAEEITAALDVLLDGEWLRPLPASPIKPQGGRPSSPRYAVNPAALESK
jgi:hypothetical protein